MLDSADGLDRSLEHRHLGCGPACEMQLSPAGGMITSAVPSYAGYRFPAEVISHAVWLCAGGAQ